MFHGNGFQKTGELQPLLCRRSQRAFVGPASVTNATGILVLPRPKLRAMLYLLILFNACCFIVSGCDRPTEYFGITRPQHSTDVLWVNNGAEAQWIDPGKCSDSNGGEIIFNTFAGLVQAHPATLEPMPDIARDWDVMDDGRRYLFHLRSSKWSDGKPLTAHDFEWSVKRLLDPRTASKYANAAYDLKHAKAYNLRAILVTGVPDSTQLEEFSRWSQRVTSDMHGVEITAMDACPDLGGFFVYLGGGKYVEGDHQRRTEIRRQVMDRFAQVRYDGQTLTVKTTDNNVIGIQALDDLTLQIDLEHPVPYFLNLLTFYSFMPVPRHVMERLEIEGVNTNLWTRPEHIVSNGPYRLLRWRFRQSMDFEKNPYYWNVDEVRTPNVRISMVESYNTALNLYYTGEIDFPGGNTSLPAEFMDTLRNFKDFRSDPYLGVYFYWFNTKQPPMDDPKVRQAFSLSVDRQSIVEYVTRAGQIPTADLVPDGLAGYEGLQNSLFDPERARQLLTEAGYPDGQGLPSVTLIYNTSEGHKQIAVAIQQMWKEHLNVDVQIQNQEWQVYLSKLEQMDFQIARMGWIGDYPDPYTFLDLLASYSGNNHSGLADAEYDALLQKSKTQQDPAKRLDILRQAEQRLLSQQPVLPIYVYTRSQLVKPYIQGFWSNYQDRHPWKYLRIDPHWYEESAEQELEAPPPLIERG
ncbi:MAG: peptide ABC transporter substrate-binding protein [Pirellulaceae bacterium]|nr:peptide ABC transporter substrate-binding protein [Pirellulaceae bacterium]